MAWTPFTEEDQPTMKNFNAKFLAAIAEAKEQAIADGVHIVTGSYVGTGTYGTDAGSCTLTLPFEPFCVIMLGYGRPSSPYWSTLMDALNNVVVMATLAESYRTKLGFSDNTLDKTHCKKSADGKSIIWYHEVSASAQCNFEGYTYYYLAIG